MTKIIVIGSSGFLGSAVLREAVVQGIEAVGVVRRVPAGHAYRHLIVADLLESPKELERAIEERQASIVVHCALAERARFDTHPDSADSITERIDSSVITACADSRFIRRVVLVSSSAVYGQLKSSENAFRETSDPNPASQYGCTKLAQERRLLTAFGDRLAIARVFNVTGAGEPASMVGGSLAQRIASSSSGTVLSIRNSQSIRDFSDIGDVARALLDIGRLGDRAPGCFNVSSGLGTTVLAFAGLILSASNRALTLEPDSLGGESRSIGDSQLLRSTTGWRNSVTLEESASSLWKSRANLSREEGDPSFR